MISAEGSMNDRRILAETRVRRDVACAVAAVRVFEFVQQIFEVEREVLDALITLVAVLLQSFSDDPRKLDRCRKSRKRFSFQDRSCRDLDY